MMANFQTDFDHKTSNYTPVEQEILRVITPQEQTSHEVHGLIQNTPALAALRNDLSGYTGAFSWDVTHVGSICADLARRGVIQRTKKSCPVTKRIEAAWHH